MLKKPTNRHFTDAAREAAKVARRIKTEQAQDPNRPEVFVVRGTEDERRFCWQIRRFGGLVLDSSASRYDSIHAAQSAGRKALQAIVE